MMSGSMLTFYDICFYGCFLCLPFCIFYSNVWLYLLVLAFMYWCLLHVRHSCRGKIKVTGQAVFISGCDTGFGHDLARRLDDVGFTVFAGCLHEEGQGAQRLQSDCSGRLCVVSVDVRKDQSVASAREFVKSRCSEEGLWALVNNAGLNVNGDVELCPIKFYHKVLNVNLYGTIRVTQAFLPLVRKAKGRIINVSSVKGCYPCPANSPYHVSKHALETLSDSIRLEMVKFGVKVSIIEPGNYGTATAINDAKRYAEEADEMWACASEEIKTAYGENYMTHMLSLRRRNRGKSSATTKPVIDALEDAIISCQPMSRYLVPGSSKDSYDKTAAIYFPTATTGELCCLLTTLVLNMEYKNKPRKKAKLVLKKMYKMRQYWPPLVNLTSSSYPTYEIFVVIDMPMRTMVPNMNTLPQFMQEGIQVFATLYPFLPTWLSDYCIIRWTGCDKLPQPLTEKQPHSS